MVKRKTGDRRIDAAIDHFIPMGFRKTDVRNIVNSLLKHVYGDDGWPFLEENCYHVVQEALLEKQQEEEKLQLQVLQKKQQQQEELQDEEEQETQHVQEQQQQLEEEDDEASRQAHGAVAQPRLSYRRARRSVRPKRHFTRARAAGAQHVQEQQHDEWEEDDEAQQQEAVMMEAPSENDMTIVKVHNEVPSEAVLAVGQTEEVVPMIINPPAPKAALPHPEATRSGRSRRPCFGWISESESDSDYEEYLASQQQLVHVPSAGGEPGQRKRPSRWDVKKEAT